MCSERTNSTRRCCDAMHREVIVSWAAWDGERDTVRRAEVSREGFLPASRRAV